MINQDIVLDKYGIIRLRRGMYQRCFSQQQGESWRFAGYVKESRYKEELFYFFKYYQDQCENFYVFMTEAFRVHTLKIGIKQRAMKFYRQSNKILIFLDWMRGLMVSFSYTSFILKRRKLRQMKNYC